MCKSLSIGYTISPDLPSEKQSKAPENANCVRISECPGGIPISGNSEQELSFSKIKIL
jgi:hypothetical protein